MNVGMYPVFTSPSQSIVTGFAGPNSPKIDAHGYFYCLEMRKDAMIIGVAAGVLLNNLFHNKHLP